MAKQSKIQHTTHQQHRARKAPKCPLCGRTRGRNSKRHPSGNAKRRSAWSADAKPCQFHKKYEE
jgi:hypothetical protein